MTLGCAWCNFLAVRGWCLTLLLIGCAKHPGSTVSPSSAADMPTWPRWIELRTHAYEQPTFGVARTSDVWVKGGSAVSATRNNVVVSTVWACSSDGCLLPHVTPSEHIALSAEKAVNVVLVPLTLPKAFALSVGKSIDLPLAPVADGDPRGWLTAASLHLDAPAQIVVDMRPVHTGPAHTGQHLPEYGLWGARGSVSPFIHGTFRGSGEPARRQYTYRLRAGDYTMRVFAERKSYRNIYCGKPSPGWPPPPAWCDEPTDELPYAVRITWDSREPVKLPTEDHARSTAPAHLVSARALSVRVAAEPKPATVSVPVPVGRDIVVSWSPAEVFVSTAWDGRYGEHRRFCHERPCVHAAADFDALRISVSNEPKATDVKVRVDALELPRTLGQLNVGKAISVQTVAVSAQDLRGPLADIVVNVEKPGEMLIESHFHFDPDSPTPQLEMYAPWGGDVSLSEWTVNIDPATGQTARRFVFETAGRYLLRVDGKDPRTPARSVKLRLTRVE